ncbi:MAG: hypothetical protein HW380_718 [Magnetococcales bacterium]|nr:hypothetical protein [Magnetococcales bacterium]HIJ85797.1 hypothetical protein [Magnetococcales bacterium]
MCRKNKMILTVFSGLLLAAGHAGAGQLMVPHQDQDEVIVHTYPEKFAHPVDYWWHLNPSQAGAWDYFSPVQDSYQPVVVEQGAPGTRPLEVMGVGLRKLEAKYASPQVTGSPLYHGRGK